jgi:hypothetical protein
MKKSSKRVWVYDPHSGGVKIPAAVQVRTDQRIRAYAEKHYAGRYTRLDVRFRGALCYVDAFTEPEEPSAALLRGRGETRDQYLEGMRNYPLHICRLRHFSEDCWSMAFFSYGGMKYEASVLDTGEFIGTPEQGFEAGAMYLQDE